MRPDSIRQFDYFYGGSGVLGLLAILSGLDHQSFTLDIATGFRSPALTSFLLTGGWGPSIWLGLLAVAVVPAVLWFLAAMRANRTARWIVLVRALLGAARLLYILTILGWLILSHLPVESWVWYCMMFGVIGETLHLAGAYFLFAPDARDWFEAGGPSAANPEEVFA